MESQEVIPSWAWTSSVRALTNTASVFLTYMLKNLDMSLNWSTFLKCFILPKAIFNLLNCIPGKRSGIPDFLLTSIMRQHLGRCSPNRFQILYEKEIKVIGPFVIAVSHKPENVNVIFFIRQLTQTATQILKN